MNSEIQNLGERKPNRILFLILGVTAIATVITIILIFTLSNKSSDGG
ncbi:MAG: hypothetical protein ACFFFT_11080 [Candidatus Thorarchaeota archaeon]